jgi:hypothetical protein
MNLLPKHLFLPVFDDARDCDRHQHANDEEEGEKHPVRRNEHTLYRFPKKTDDEQDEIEEGYPHQPGKEGSYHGLSPPRLKTVNPIFGSAIPALVISAYSEES